MLLECVELTSGDVLVGLREGCAAADPPVTDAAVVSIVGAVDTFMVSGLDRETHAVVSCDGKMAEMSGTGEVVDGVPHIHGVFGTNGGGTVACGHLEAAQVATGLFVRVYLARSVRWAS